ncbi:MAG: hypothetical protein QM723_09635 [Myxococcaceae bacterium]
MSIRAILAGLVVGLVAAFIYFLPGSPPPPPQPPVPEAVAAPDASVAAPKVAVAEPESAPVPETVNFAEGFCSESGGESVVLHFTLEKLLSAQLVERIDSGAAGPDTDVMTAWVQGAKPEALLEEAKKAEQALPNSPWPKVAAAIALHSLGQNEQRVEKLRDLRKLLPDDPAVAMALADATRDAPDLDEAIDGLSVYLKHEAAPALSRLRARLEVQRDIQKEYRRSSRGGITLLWPEGSLTPSQADELLAAIDRGLDDAAAFTATRRRDHLTAVVYPSRSELLAVSCVRNWTAALYDGVLRTVAVPNDAGVDLKVLRHETLHAQLSPLAPLAPKWFHEGVAQAFAQERLPKRAWKQMVNNKVWIPFSSLDGSFQVFANGADADLAYAQSYAMAELMREKTGDRAVSSALVAFQSGADTPTAFAKACGEPEVTGDELLRSIEQRLDRER